MKTIMKLLSNLKFWFKQEPPSAEPEGVDDEYGEHQFIPGQKVYVTYYNVYIGDRNVFRPPQAGVIIKKGQRKYHFLNRSATDGLVRWYWVKFESGTFEIPNTCIQDLELYIKGTERFLNGSKHLIGEKGYSKESFNTLTNYLDKAKDFNQ